MGNSEQSRDDLQLYISECLKEELPIVTIQPGAVQNAITFSEI